MLSIPERALFKETKIKNKKTVGQMEARSDAKTIRLDV